MRISTLTRKWNISEQIIKSFLIDQDNNFDLSADEISEKQYESLIMHFGKEEVVDESKGIVTYSFEIKGATQTYIVRKKDKLFLDVEGFKMFSSVVVSNKTQPVMLTLNRYNGNGNYERGIVSITNNGELFPMSFLGFSFDFIDGVDHGLARVKRNNKWGIIGYNSNTFKFEVVLSIGYDSIWNFYKKNISIVNVEKERESSRIDLRSLDSYQLELGTLLAEEQSPMKGITHFSVSNFKRFKDEVSFDLGGINFIVGPNNAGKSTMGKALMLAYYNLMYYVSHPATGSRYPSFYLSPKGYDGLTQESIKSAFCSKQNSDRYMTFTLTANGCKSTMNVYCTESEQSQTFAFIHCWEIEDEQTGVLCKFDFHNEKASLFTAEEEIYSYEQNAFWNAPTSNITGSRLIDSLIDSFLNRLEEEHRSLESASEEVDVIEELQRNANEIDKVQQCLTERQKSFFKDSFSTLYEKPEFIYSNSGVSRILDSDDKNNHIAQIARDYYFMTKNDVGKENALKVQKILAELVIKYLSDDYFKIGKDIEVEEDEGSYYKIFIKKFDSERENLANYGRGTIQVVLLLMKMAVAIFDNVRDNQATLSIILVEEPEQNMHPNWQSILAQMFADAYNLKKDINPKSPNFTFLIETHSEYLIRRIQLIVSNYKCSNEEELRQKNVFSVFNLYSEGLKKLGLDIFGHFDDFFIDGFYDVAMQDVIDLSKNERKRKS